MLLPLKKIRLLVIGLSIVSMAGTGCTTLREKLTLGPSKAEIAEQKKQEHMHAEKMAAKKASVEKAEKEAAKKKAETAEDTIQLKQIKTVATPAAEKLPEEAEASAVSSKMAMPMVAASHPSTSMGDERPVLNLPTEPNTYLVTVEKKNKTHPFFNQGDNRGFVLNGKQGQYIIAKQGDEITFRVKTGVQHDFYLTTTPKGWGAAPFTAGVEGQFTYKGDVSFKPTKNTPSDLYYGCRNHNAMGGHIVVVAPNADLDKVMAELEATRKAAAKNAKSAVNAEIKPQKVRQKISYVGMLLQFKGKGLPDDRKAAIEARLNDAKALQKKGELAAALSAAEEAGAMFKGADKKVALTAEEIAELKEELNDYMITLEAFIDSHKASYQQAEKQGAKLVDYDHDAVEKLVVGAVKLSDKQKFEAAKKQIKKAERIVTKALNDMLNATTIVYDLNFETPADEYAYEVKKYEGYLELIPVAIEVKKPRPGSIKLMRTYVKKGEFYKGKADEAAKEERWDEAMAILRDATIETRRGLRLLGVSM